jgi:uncharacterized protein YbjT (DUF2867 family)
MSIIIIGGTGTLGRQIVKKALEERYKVICIVRDFRRAAFLKKWGAELIYGDLSIPATIPIALKGSTIVIDSSTVRSSSSYTSETIDWKGKLALLEACKLMGIKKYVSCGVFTGQANKEIPLMDLKIKMEKKIKNSKLNYTIFQCSGFFQGLISQYALPILENEVIWLQENEVPIAFLDTQDAASAIIQSLNSKKYDKATVSLLGEKFWTARDVVQLCEDISGNTAKVSYIPLLVFIVLQRFFRFFEFTWNIADRLQFGEVNSNEKIFSTPSLEFNWSGTRRSLGGYFQEYFSKIRKKLRETNYQQTKNDNNISFL